MRARTLFSARNGDARLFGASLIETPRALLLGIGGWNSATPQFAVTSLSREFRSPTWSDCGSSSTHHKFSFLPSFPPYFLPSLVLIFTPFCSFAPPGNYKPMPRARCLSGEPCHLTTLWTEHKDGPPLKTTQDTHPVPRLE